ncbi:MAG: TonB-dependent siderophore receptor [Aquabacterium sp.]
MALFGVTLSAGASHAQQTTAPPPSDGSATLPAVTVTAQRPTETATGPVQGFAAKRSATGTKTDTPILEIPQSISVITRDELDARGATSVTEAVRYTPGVQAETYGADTRGNEWFYLRGFDASNTSSYRDGLRQFGASYTFFRGESYGLERIEVLRGPSSVMFGSGEAGGVINRVSKRPTADAVNEVELQLGSFDRKQLAGDFGGRLNADGTLLYRLVGVGLDTGTQDKYPDGLRVKNERTYIAPSFTWTPSADTTFTLLTDYLHNRTNHFSAYYTAYDQNENPTIPTDVLLGEPNYTKYDQDQSSVGYQFEHRFNDVWTFKQNLRVAHASIDYRPLFDGDLTGTTLTRQAIRYDEHLDETIVDTSVQARFNTGEIQHQVLLGFDWLQGKVNVKHYKGDAPDLDIANPIYGQPVSLPTQVDTAYDQTLKQLGVYVQDQLKFTPNWILTLGGRQDRAETDTDTVGSASQSRVDSAFTSRAGLTYLIGGGWAPYASYAESFLPQSGTTKNGQAMVPTRGKQYEAGIKYQPANSSLLVTAALFDLTKTNVVTTDPTDSHFKVQTGEVNSRGLELEAKGDLTRNLSATASYTYNNVKITKTNNTGIDEESLAGKRMPLVPKQMASFWLDYTVHAGELSGLGFGAGVRYVGARYDDDDNLIQQPSYTLLDAAIRYETGNWRFALTGQNLTNKDYIANCYYDCYRGVERSFVASARYRW